MRRGFTTIEILVTLAILVILAALVLPQVASEARDATAPAVLSSSATIADAVSQFKADTRRYPGTLQALTTNAGTPVDVCGSTIPAGLLARWSGPYLQQHVPATGLPAGDAVILSGLGRADPSGTTVSSLIITAVGVTQDAATRIERDMDGDADFSGGTIRWTSPDTLRYFIPIRGC